MIREDDGEELDASNLPEGYMDILAEMASEIESEGDKE